ncbi:hypothetical protein [Embleya sp. NPDC059237]|uniref:hypothetical protein n=1 Tax=Embleya sp. NPDC059237 TaxID=3346784 RepID=UPI0036B3C91B
MTATAWSARLDIEAAPTDDDVDVVLERLAEHSPAVGTTTDGNLTVRIAVEAATARRATETALDLVAAATGAAGLDRTVIALEVTRWDEFERALARPIVPATADLAEPPDVGRTRAG